MIHNTTWCGTFQKNTGTPDVPAPEFLFFTLFWLCNYPTLNLLSGLLHLHECTCTQILKHITIAMASVLQGEIAWPSDEEFDQLTFSTYSNGSLEEIVCIADGTEIEISHPSDLANQRCTWSGKKKQNSLNVMIITKLNGKTLYFSPLCVGAHEQAHWNEIGTQNWFLGMKYGIMADRGFSFNQKRDSMEIISTTPHKKKCGQSLTPSKKDYNQKLSETQVTVENSILHLKVWKILKKKCCHWRNRD